ncbi:hypothetical protein D9M72_418520 [compost metagenome]
MARIWSATFLFCSRLSLCTLITIWPLICEMLSRMLSRTGCEKLGSMPGSWRRFLSISPMMPRLLKPSRHCFSGLRSTRISTVLISLGSVPSSGRPTLEMVVLTSGVLRITLRSSRAWSRASSTETDAGRSKLTHIEPSSSSGRNSLPRNLPTPTVATSRPRAVPITIFLWSSAQASIGS